MAGPAVVVVGASRFGRQIARYVIDGGGEVSGYLDDAPTAVSTDGIRLLGTTMSYEPNEANEVLIAVSEPAHRKVIAERLVSKGVVLHTLIHPTAYVSTDANIEPGSIVCPLAHIGAGARLGSNVLVNTHTLVGHDANIGPHSALMRACINGASSIGEGVFAGTYSSVNPGLSIGDWSKITAGSVVYQDMRDRVLISGNPARAAPLLIA